MIKVSMSTRKWAIVDTILHEGAYDEMRKLFDASKDKNIKLVEILEE